MTFFALPTTTYLLVVMVMWHGVSGQGQYADVIKSLFDKVAAEQAQETVPFVAGEHMYHKRGVYGSYIKQNWHGDAQMAEARRTLGCYDNNMFATAWVTSAILEAYSYGNAPKPSEQQLEMALESLSNHHDQNRKYNNSLMTFWEQLYNKNASYYNSSPYNIVHVLDMSNNVNWTQIEPLLEKLGLGEFAHLLHRIAESKDGYMRAFHIPPDFDDTFVNIGLGSLLYENKVDFPGSWKIWADQNTNLTSVFDALKKYAYRPFSDDRNVNSLDPRTYVWIMDFLEEAHSKGRNVSIVPTWIQNLEELETEYSKGVIMPFEINNVDATVAANTVYGINAAILTGVVSADVLDDPEIESVYHNTSALLAYEINNNMTNRPDLTLLYYPSQIEYDWFVARSFALLHAHRSRGTLPKPIMEEVYQTLKSAVEGEMTKYILFQANYDSFGRIYYDDFLGDGDLTKDNKTLKRAEDRIFTTSMAANALMYTWTTVNDTTKKIEWRPEAPTVVRKTVKGIMDWLSANVLGLDFDPWNAFFSGSCKGPSTCGYHSYPYNVHEYLNGTKIDEHHEDWHVPHTRCLRGYVDPKNYTRQMIEKHSEMVFHGYNYFPENFPYWSSTGYTYAISLLSFSIYDNLLSNVDI